MTDVKLGQLRAGFEQRDAIHVAVLPAIAGQKLAPGQHVGLDVFGHAVPLGVKLLGIVDPFLDGPVFPNERFWILLYQNSVTSLRHDWTHPSIQPAPPQPDRTESENWLRRLADNLERTYEELVAEIGQGEFRGYGTPEDAYDNMIAKHYEAVTGRRIDPDNLYFYCSC